MTARQIDRVSGSIFDVAELQALTDEVCNVVFCSDRTLYLMQHFALNEVNWLARYAESFNTDGIFYHPVTSGSADVGFVENVARLYRLEIEAMSLDALVTALDGIRSAILAQDCGCSVGEGADTESGESGGSVPRDIGDISFFEPAYQPDRKCRVANWIWSEYRAFFNQLAQDSVDTMTGFSLSLVTSAIGAVVGAAVGGPFGALLGAAVGVLAGLAGQVLLGNVDFSDIVTLLDSEDEDLVCALYTAYDAASARSAFLDVLDTAGMSAANLTAVQLCMPNAILDILFFDSSVNTESAIAGHTPTVDCSACGGSDSWDFDSDAESWTASDISTGTATATGSYDASAEDLKSVHYVPITALVDSRVRWTSPTLTQAVTPGAFFTFDFGAPSDGILTGYFARLVYTDASSEQASVTSTAAGQVTIVSTQTKTVDYIEVEIGRSQGAFPTEEWNFSVHWDNGLFVY